MRPVSPVRRTVLVCQRGDVVTGKYVYGGASPGAEASSVATARSIRTWPRSVRWVSSTTVSPVSGSRVAYRSRTAGASSRPSTRTLLPPRQASAKSNVTSGRRPSVRTTQRRDGSRSWSPRWFHSVSEVTSPSSYQRSPWPVLKTLAKGTSVTVERSATETAGARQRSVPSGRDGSRERPVQKRSSAAWKSPGARRSAGSWWRVHSGR